MGLSALLLLMLMSGCGGVGWVVVVVTAILVVVAVAARSVARARSMRVCWDGMVVAWCFSVLVLEREVEMGVGGYGMDGRALAEGGSSPSADKGGGDGCDWSFRHVDLSLRCDVGGL